MSLNFLPKPDMQLENSPLVEVICQVRFPPILRIAIQEPSEYQELVRDEFPLLQVEQGFMVRIPGPGVKAEPVAEPQPRIHRFRTADEQTAISIAADFYALSTNRYITWKEFARQLGLAHDAMQRVYKPVYATRIGLRYVNRLTPMNTGCKSVAEMFELLRSELSCQSRSEAWSMPTEAQCRLVLTDADARLTLGAGFGEQDKEPFLLLDLDYFEEGKLELDGLVERCTRYNDVLYRAFRWCILDEKLDVFRPKAKEPSK
jgi:uncharacterized protein (TIGR04255 family)